MVEDEAERLELVDGRIQLRLGPQPLHRPAGSQRSTIQAAREVVQLAAERPEAGHAPPSDRSAARSPDAAQPEEREAALASPGRRQQPDGERRQEGRLLGRAADRDGPSDVASRAIEAATPAPKRVLPIPARGATGRSAATAARARAGEGRLVAPQSVQALDAEEGPAEGRRASGRSRPRYPA